MEPVIERSDSMKEITEYLGVSRDTVQMSARRNYLFEREKGLSISRLFRDAVALYK